MLSYSWFSVSEWRVWVSQKTEGIEHDSQRGLDALYIARSKALRTQQCASHATQQSSSRLSSPATTTHNLQTHSLPSVVRMVWVWQERSKSAQKYPQHNNKIPENQNRSQRTSLISLHSSLRNLILDAVLWICLCINFRPWASAWSLRVLSIVMLLLSSSDSQSVSVPFGMCLISSNWY